MRRVLLAVSLAAALPAAATAQVAPAKPHNVIIYVADGLRYGIVDAEHAPAMAALKAEGVDFTASHSLLPTITTPNASAIATGHKLGDTGDFGNTVFAGTPALPLPGGSLVVGYEDDPTLGAMNDRFEGDYLGRASLLATARAAGYATAAIGKLGPAAIQDVTARDGTGGIVIDDDTGKPTGIPLAPDVIAAITAAGLPAAAPGRGDNADAGTYQRPGTKVANIAQSDWFISVATKVLLPRFKQAGKPFAMVVWSRDPDGTQHNEGDSFLTAEPGINGPTTFAAIRNADDGLARLRAALREQGLEDSTDIVVTADHGFSTAWKQSQTSGAAKRDYKDTPKGFLPYGFLAIDLADALKLPLSHGDGKPVDLAGGNRPNGGAGLLGADPKAPEVVVGPNGGADLIWLPTAKAKDWARQIAAYLTTQDYTGALFVDDRLGPVPGALPLSAIGMVGDARTPRPAMVVSFRSIAGSCGRPEICALDITDASQQQGQGTHGSFSRANTRNFMAAVGPDFKRGYASPTPVSNADWAPTIAKALGLKLPDGGAVPGRVMTEALKGGKATPHKAHVTRSAPAANGFTTVLSWRSVGKWSYYDTAGAPGRVVGAP